MRGIATLLGLLLITFNAHGWNYFKQSEIKEGVKQAVVGPSPNAFKMESMKGEERIYINFDATYTEAAKEIVLTTFTKNGFALVGNKEESTLAINAKSPAYEWSKKGSRTVNKARLFEIPTENPSAYLSSKDTGTIDSFITEGLVHALVRKAITSSNENSPFLQIVRVEFEVEGEKYSDRSAYGNRKFTASAGVSDSDVRSGVDDLFKSAVICAVECER